MQTRQNSTIVGAIPPLLPSVKPKLSNTVTYSLNSDAHWGGGGGNMKIRGPPQHNGVMKAIKTFKTNTCMIVQRIMSEPGSKMQDTIQYWSLGRY